jgi:hypothetical protein
MTALRRKRLFHNGSFSEQHQPANWRRLASSFVS